MLDARNRKPCTKITVASTEHFPTAMDMEQFCLSVNT